MAYKVRKTEHNGAKNGGGHWGRRTDAKRQSSHARRVLGRRDVVAELGDRVGGGGG